MALFHAKATAILNYEDTLINKARNGETKVFIQSYTNGDKIGDTDCDFLFSRFETEWNKEYASTPFQMETSIHTHKAYTHSML